MEIRVTHLYKAYGEKEVLRDVTFTAGTGLHCLSAPSGGGKTTLLRILLGLERADSGEVSTDGRCRWAVVFQEDRLLEHLDAKANLRLVLGSSYHAEKAEVLLNELGLGDVGSKRAAEFSGGMKRRLALARALLAPADVLVLDEPFTGLDEQTHKRCLELVRRAAEEKVVFLATHHEADTAGTQIIRL